MTTNSNELPSIEEELNRKAFEELENLVNRHELGKITDAEYSASINTLFAVCSGLVEREFFELITAAGAEVNKSDSSFSRKRLFCKDNKLMILSQRPSIGGSSSLVTITAFSSNEKMITGGVDEVQKKMSHFITKLEAIDFHEII